MRWIKILGKIADASLIVVFVFMILLVLNQVITRYVSQKGAVIWSEDATIFCFVWLTWIGAAIATKERRHLVMGLVQESLPAPIQRWLQVVVDVGVIFFLSILFYKSFPVIEAFSSQYFSSVPTVSIKYTLFCLPSTSGLMMIYYLNNLISDLRAVFVKHE